jgi:DNA-binding transcriptional LysR family regulator
MEIFLAVVEEGSFAAAARRKCISAPSVTRVIASLEKRVGQVLFLRDTRNMNLSSVGQSFLLDCRHIFTEIREAEASAKGNRIAPSGLLTIAAPLQFGELIIAPLVNKYLNQFPDVSISCLFVDRIVEMVDENVDILIRVGSLDAERMHAIKIGEVRQVVCASPLYLQRHGRPEAPEQLIGRETVNSTGGEQTHVWQFQRQGRALTVTPDSRVVVTSNSAAIKIAREGWGITRALLYQVANDLKRGRLELLLQNYEPLPIPVHMVFRNRTKVSSKTSTFADFLIGRIVNA